jgi:hypothetical protein
LRKCCVASRLLHTAPRSSWRLHTVRFRHLRTTPTRALASRHAAAVQFYEQSAYCPCAPPEGSKLRDVLTTISLGAMSQGKWGCAERSLRAAGETLLLTLLHALQHNREALQAAVAGTSAASAMHTLAMLLLVADARIGLRSMLQKDWHLSRHGPSPAAADSRVRCAHFCERACCPADASVSGRPGCQCNTATVRPFMQAGARHRCQHMGVL